jgi:hypothetical protein
MYCLKNSNGNLLNSKGLWDIENNLKNNWNSSNCGDISFKTIYYEFYLPSLNN